MLKTPSQTSSCKVSCQLFSEKTVLAFLTVGLVILLSILLPSPAYARTNDGVPDVLDFTHQLYKDTGSSQTTQPSTPNKLPLAGNISPPKSLKNCRPAKNCRANDKPCFVEVPQDDFRIFFVGGEDPSNNPLRPRAAIRLRMCTGVDDVCESGSQNQRFVWVVGNQTPGGSDFMGTLQTRTGVLDTGPYTEIGPHTIFAGTCLLGDEPCKIAWQYCELEFPLVQGILGAP